jgi:3-deoxy-D-manno-octulosonate 8-phosphate phosphatase (KDO 8-P phosphatase)
VKDDALAERCRGLKLILSDVDGVMTDGRLWLLPDGTEAKAFHVRDGLAITLAHRAGLRTGLLSGRTSKVVEARAAELRISIVRLGASDKGSALREILSSESLRPEEIAYIGDDVNDLPVIQSVALSAAPADAVLEVRAQAFMVMDAPGGRGCLREFIEAILRARGDWEMVVASLGAARS